MPDDGLIWGISPSSNTSHAERGTKRLRTGYEQKFAYISFNSLCSRQQMLYLA